MTTPTPTAQPIWICLACPDQPQFTHAEMHTRSAAPPESLITRALHQEP